MNDPLIGRRFGPYEIRSSIGRGGMARVYRAFDHNLQREVAFKVLYNPAQEADFAERFIREARTLASLKHPGIVQIYNVGQEDAINYIVQELLAGPTLEDELAALHARGQFMDAAEVQRLIGQLASALDYAHGRGIIHRDLKPSNMLRNQHGGIVLVDFGIAKSMTSVDKLTRTGIVMGTPTYLAPEQALGGAALGPSVDIYALGVVLFEMLTGRVPFDDPSPLSVALAHVNQPPPSVCALRPELPPAVEQVVLQALVKEPAQRYPNVGALAADLAAAWAAGAAPQPEPAVYITGSGKRAPASPRQAEPAAPGPVPARTTPPTVALHQAQTAVNPDLAQRVRQQQPASHQAATTVNPALADRSRPGRPPAESRPGGAPPPALPPASDVGARTGPPRGALIAAALVLLLFAVWVMLNGGGDAATTDSGQVAIATPGQPAPAGEAEPPAAGVGPEQVLVQTSAALNQALSSGQVEPKVAEDLQKKLAEAQEKLAEGDSKEVRKKLAELRRKIDEAERERKLAAQAAAELRGLLAQLDM